MRFVLMAVRIAVLSLTLTAGSCGGGGQPRLQPLPENVRAPCARPETFLGESDFAIMAGQLGTELIHCNNKRAAAVYGYDSAEQILKDYWGGNW